MAHSRLLRGIALIACAVGVAALTACDLVGEGAGFNYPSAPPLPPGATVIAKATGWDDDDPMRGREVVIDVGSVPPTELIEFYRERFPSDEGWLQGTPDPAADGGQLLCLVSHTDEGFDEYVEIYPYNRRFKSEGLHRYLASVSRLEVERDGGERTVDRCGLAGIWFPADL